MLVGEQLVVHRPEAALRIRRLGRFGGVQGVRMDLREREVAVDKAQAVAEAPLELGDDGEGAPGVRALIVAVLDQRQRGVGRREEIRTWPNKTCNP